jgi:hypothetical protein
MSALGVGKAIAAMISYATILIIVIFANFLLRRTDATVLGVMLPARLAHFILGPVLVLLNAVILVYLCALYKMTLGNSEITQLQHLQKYKFFGSMFNPFYVAGNPAANAIGYAFLITLWWLGMWSFIYSIGLNPEADGPWLFGWQSLISVLFLALGLASMIAIQACWSKIGFDLYRIKYFSGFLGIAIGAFVPPVLLRHGLPFMKHS